MTTRVLLAFAAWSFLACVGPETASTPVRDPVVLEQEVRDTELAFAATMAARDLEAFRTFLADEAVFFTPSRALRGKDAVAEAWSVLFEAPEAPFSWAPDLVEVLPSGDLALTSGPVTAADGSSAGRFTSIWRRQADGWRIVFDKGD
jgi:ketosteroid isomerase-like protein